MACSGASLYRDSDSNFIRPPSCTNIRLRPKQNPAGIDESNECVTFHNPSNESVDIGNWTFESAHGTTVIDWIAEGTTLYPRAYCACTPFYRWLNNSEEAIIIRNAKGEEVGKTIQYTFIATIS